jgi:hypothetical protein
MSIHRLAVVVLVPLLAVPSGAPVAAAAPQAPAGSNPAASGLQVALDTPHACVVAGEHPQFQGTITPVSGVNRARLFFRSTLTADLYYVEAVLAGGRAVARLPCPHMETGSISFYLDATGDGSGGRSADGDAQVVRKSEDCSSDRTLAPISPGGAVRAFDVAGNPAVPRGFDGVVGGATACETRVPIAAAGGGNFFGTTAGIVTLAAAGLGIAAVIHFATRENEPTSPSR